MEKIRSILERSAFGVCTYLGDKMGIATNRVRLFFIYATFVAMGSPIIFYLIIAFWVNIRHYIRRRNQHPLWD